MSGSFNKRRVTIAISIGKGKNGDEGADIVTLTGHRVVADISMAGGESMGALQMRVYGLKQELMHQLTTIGPIATAIRFNNAVSISVGDDTNMGEIFSGTIDKAWGDYQGMPDASLNIVAFAGYNAAIKPIPARSYKGPTYVANIMADLAKIMGVAFENNGVYTMLSSPAFNNTAWQQVQACARAADIYFALDRGVLAIWPKNGNRSGAIPLISPDTGMVGYPAFSSNGIVITTLLNPNIQLGGQVDILSSLPMANGRWNISNVSHAFESENPGGAWFTRIEGFPATPTGTT